MVDEELSVSGLMLSALVLYLNENDAGPGFYKLAVQRGLLPSSATANERRAFWVGQVTALQGHYRGSGRRGCPRRGDDR